MTMKMTSQSSFIVVYFSVRSVGVFLVRSVVYFTVKSILELRALLLVNVSRSEMWCEALSAVGQKSKSRGPKVAGEKAWSFSSSSWCSGHGVQMC